MLAEEYKQYIAVYWSCKVNIFITIYSDLEFNNKRYHLVLTVIHIKSFGDFHGFIVYTSLIYFCQNKSKICK